MEHVATTKKKSERGVTFVFLLDAQISFGALRKQIMVVNHSRQLSKSCPVFVSLKDMSNFTVIFQCWYAEVLTESLKPDTMTPFLEMFPVK